MSGSEDFADWLAKNKDLKGTPDYATVSSAYEQTKTEENKNLGAQWYKNTPYSGSIAALGSAAQGASFNFADEVGGAINAVRNPLSPVESYKTGRDAFRGATEAYKKEYPISSTGAELSGGLLWGGPFKAITKAVGVAPATGPLGRMGQSSSIGGIAGAVGGAGAAENLSDIPAEVVKQGAFGVGLSPVLQGIGMTAGGILDAITPWITRGPEMIRNIGGTAARNLALERVGNAIVQDESSVGRVARRMGKLDPYGNEARIADSAGQSTRDLLDTMTTLPGTTRNRVETVIRQRQAGRPERMDVLPELLNQGQRASPTLEALQLVKEQQSRPLYAAVQDRVIPITPALETLFERPAFREAYDHAVTNAANRGVKLPSLDEIVAQKKNIGAFWPAGQNANEVGQPVAVWDEVKKALDDIIAVKKKGLNVRTPSNKNQAQSTLQSSLDIKDELVSEVDRLTGNSYKRARDAFAGPAAMQSALEDGSQVWSKNANQIVEMTAKMSQSEREAFRIGAGEVLRDKVGSQGGQTQLLNAWKDRTLREKLQAIYGDERTYRQAISKIYAENELRRLEAVGRGSKTARATADQSDFADAASDVAAIGVNAKRGNVLGMWEAAKNVGKRVTNTEPVRNEIGRILLQGGPEAHRELARLNDIIKRLEERNAGQAAITGVLGGAI